MILTDEGIPYSPICENLLPPSTSKNSSSQPMPPPIQTSSYSLDNSKFLPEKQGQISTVIFSEGYSEDTGRTRKSKIGNVERTEKYREITRCVLGVPRCTENCRDSTVYFKKILYSVISRIQTDKKCSRQDYPARQLSHFNSKLMCGIAPIPVSQ